MWRRRQWRRLLNLIDRLPANSFFYQELVNDEEYVRMLIEAEDAAKRQGKLKTGPPMATWSPELAQLVVLQDEIAALRYAVIAVNSEKGKAGPPPKPAPRPVTAFDRIRLQVKLQRHEALADRLLARRKRPKPAAE